MPTRTLASVLSRSGLLSGWGPASLLALVLMLPAGLLAQGNDDKAAKKDSKPHTLTIGGYLDSYLSWYSDERLNRQDFSEFAFANARDEMFGLNIAQISADYSHDRVRGAATFMYGDIPQSAWYLNPDGSLNALTFIQEANVGVRLVGDLWLDVGIFTSHLSGHALLPKDNIASSMAIGAWYRPFYHAGAELSYTFSDKWFAKVLVANGYGTNAFVDNNRNKAAGYQLQFTPADAHELNLSALYSNEQPQALIDADVEDQYRFYHTLYYRYTSKVFHLLAGADIALQRNSDFVDVEPALAMAYSAQLAAKVYPIPQFGIYARGEFFNDEHGFLSGQGLAVAQNAWQMMYGGTFGLEARPVKNCYIRTEARYLQADQRYFIDEVRDDNVAGPVASVLGENRIEVSFTAGIWFDSGNLIPRKR